MKKIEHTKKQEESIKAIIAKVLELEKLNFGIAAKAGSFDAVSAAAFIEAAKKQGFELDRIHKAKLKANIKAHPTTKALSETKQTELLYKLAARDLFNDLLGRGKLQEVCK